MKTISSFASLDTGVLSRVYSFLGPSDQASFSATNKTTRQAGTPTDVIEQRTCEKVRQLAINFVQTAQETEQSTHLRDTYSTSFKRIATLGADVLVKKSCDPERSACARVAYLGAAVGAVPLGVGVVALSLSLTFAHSPLFIEAICSAIRSSSAGRTRQQRHDKRRAVRGHLDKLQSQLSDIPTCVNPDKLREALGPAIDYLEVTGAHDKLRMRQPEGELERIVSDHAHRLSL